MVLQVAYIIILPLNSVFGAQAGSYHCLFSVTAKRISINQLNVFQCTTLAMVITYVKQMLGFTDKRIE